MKPLDIHTELTQQKRGLEPHVELYDTLRYRYAASFFDQTEYEPENTCYVWVTNVLSQIVHNNPTWIVESQKGGKSAQYAVVKKKALDRWSYDIKLAEFLQNGPALNAQFLRGIAVMTRAKHDRGPVFDDDSMWPTLEDISPRDYVEDGTAKDHDKCLWKAHRIVEMRSDVLKRAKENPDEGWNVELIEKMQASTSEMSKLDQTRRGSINRDEIVRWQVWFRSMEGFEGPVVADILETTGDLDENEEYEWLRKPRDWYGPSWGPYYHFDCLKIPDEAHGLAPMVANKKQSEDLNAAARALLEAENAYKEFVVIDEMTIMAPDGKTKKSAGKKLAEVIQQAKNRHIYTAPAFTQDKAKQMRIGGASAELQASVASRLDRSDRGMGLSQSRQGNTSSGNTATSDVIADSAAERKIGLIRLAVHRTTQRIGEGFLWYLENDEQLAILVGSDPEIGEVWAAGGSLQDDDERGGYDCKIEPMSMELVSPAMLQAQAGMVGQFFGEFAPLMPMNPHIDWRRLAQVYGNAWNVPYMGEMIRPDILAQMQGLQVAAQMSEMASQKQEPEQVKSVPAGSVGQPKLGAPTAHPGGGGSQGKPQGMGNSPLTGTTGSGSKGSE